jgi:ribosomal protein S18 acetylase RimI-like enzyme
MRSSTTTCAAPIDPVDAIAIRSARPVDARQILDLQRSAYQIEAERYGDFALPPLTETLDDLLARFATHTVLVASPALTEAGDQPSGARLHGDATADPIVGTVRAQVVDGTAHISRLAVRPELHGRGIGRQLLEAIEQAVGPVARFELFTGHRSARNLRLYERAGYRRTRTVRESDRVSLTFLEKPGG